MKIKLILGSIIIALALVFLSMNFLESKVEYGTFSQAIELQKKIQVKGAWIKEKESFFDAEKHHFVFYMKDDSGMETKVILDGAKPNNFELAESVVAKGTYTDGVFYASDVLTKCPSKYEGNAETMKKTL
jgi:cytochrome c-type biogenesis protein CcmE